MSEKLVLCADDPEQFTEDLRADLDTVLHSYRFENVMVSLNKNYNFDPPLDTISEKNHDI